MCLIICMFSFAISLILIYIVDVNNIVKVVTDLSYHLLGSKDVALSNMVDGLPFMNVCILFCLFVISFYRFCLN